MIGFLVGMVSGMFLTLLTLFVLTSFDFKVKEVEVGEEQAVDVRVRDGEGVFTLRGVEVSPSLPT